MNIPRMNFGSSAVLLSTGKTVYLAFGGIDALSGAIFDQTEEYLPSLGTWQLRPQWNLLTGVTYFTITALEYETFIFGGRAASGLVTSVQIFSNETDSFVFGGPLSNTLEERKNGLLYNVF